MIITLPAELDKALRRAVKRLERRNEKTLANKAAYFAYDAISSTYNTHGIGGMYYGYHRDEIRSMLGHRTYLDLLQEFEADGLIQIDSTYSADGGKTKAYKINTTYLDGDLVSYHVPYRPPGHLTESLDFVEAYTLDILRDCAINIDLARACILDHIGDESKYLRSVVRGCCEPFYRKIYVYSTKYDTYKKLTNISHDLLMNKWCDDGYEVIKQGKDKYYCMPWAIFNLERKRKIKHYWNDTINRFGKGDYFIKRDGNGRLYSNIVNMPGPLLRYIEYNDHRFKELDLKSSQFTFLLYCLEHPEADNCISQMIRDEYSSLSFQRTPGYQFFKSLIQRGQLYEEVQRWLGKASRAEAKTELFALLFSKVKQTDTNDMAIIRNIFGTVVKICDRFKTIHGYAALANELQKVEANIMVDGVLKSLQESGYPVLSKHDSFLIPGNLIEVVKPNIANQLDRIFGSDNYRLV